MRPFTRGVLWTACCTLSLVFPAIIFAQGTQDAAGSDSQLLRVSNAAMSPTSSAANDSQAVVDSSLAASELPDSPGATQAQAQESSSKAGSSQQQNSSSSSANTNSSQSAEPAPDSQDQKLQRPVGTAAAEAPKVSGITAAEPAGVAIAPAKQRRTRSIVLKVGAIIAGGAALGTVLALSAGTSSKPPGAH